MSRTNSSFFSPAMSAPKLKVVMLGGCDPKLKRDFLRLAGQGGRKLPPSCLPLDFVLHTLHLASGCFQLQIWDTAGQDRFGRVVPLYYRGARAVILIYDPSDRVSFERLVRSNAARVDGLPSILVEHSFGPGQERQVTLSQARELAVSCHAEYLPLPAVQTGNLSVQVSIPAGQVRVGGVLKALTQQILKRDSTLLGAEDEEKIVLNQDNDLSREGSRGCCR